MAQKVSCGAMNSLLIRFAWGSSGRGNSVCCLIIFVTFIGLGRAYSFGDILKLSCGEGLAKKGWDHFYGGS